MNKRRRTKVKMEQIVVFAIEIIVLVLGSALLLKNQKIVGVFDKVERVIKKYDKLYEYGLPILSAIVASGFVYYGHDWGGDFSQYILEGIGLADGDITTVIDHMQFVLENSIPGMCPAVYPWGLPIIIALVYKVFGYNLIAFRCIGIVFLAVFLLFVYKFLRERFEVNDVLIMIMLFIGCKHYNESATSILTDMPCACFSMIAIYVLYKMIACENNKQYLYGIIFGICSICAYALRTTGLVLILTLLCIHVVILIGKVIPFVNAQVNKTGLKKVIIGAHIIPYVIFFGGKFVLETVLPVAGNDYLKFIEGMPVYYPLTNLWYYLTILRDFFDVGNYLAIICGIVLLVLILTGMVVKFHKEAISIIYILGTIAALMIFPYVSGIRYIFGLYPMYLMFAAYGFEYIISLIKKNRESFDEAAANRVFRYVSACVCGFMMVFCLRMIVKLHVLPHIDSAYQPYAIEAYDYLKENTEEDAVVMFFKPRVLYLMAQRYSYNTYDDVNDLEKSDYVFLFKKDNFNNLRAYIDEHPQAYELVFINDNFKIYKHNK